VWRGQLHTQVGSKAAGRHGGTKKKKGKRSTEVGDRGKKKRETSYDHDFVSKTALMGNKKSQGDKNEKAVQVRGAGSREERSE